MTAGGLGAEPVRWSLERGRAAQLVAIGLAAFVAASHLEAAVGAFAYSPRLSLALAGVGVATGGWAVRVGRRPSRPVLLGGAGAALVLVGLWLWTRAVGVPLDDAQPAPVGVLDALTAFDELLLAAFAFAAARAGSARRSAVAARERWPLTGTVAISLSFVALAMGCEPSTAPAANASPTAASRNAALICHLY